MRFQVKQRVVERDGTFELHGLLAILVNLRRHPLGDPLLDDPRRQPFIAIEQRVNRPLGVVPGAVVVVPDVL